MNVSSDGARQSAGVATPPSFHPLYYAPLKWPFRRPAVSFMLKKGREKEIQDEWCRLQSAPSRPEFIVCMKFASCWPGVLKGGRRAAGAIQGIGSRGKPEKACGIPSGFPLVGLRGARADEGLAWMTSPLPCQHLQRAENISNSLLVKSLVPLSVG